MIQLGIDIGTSTIKLAAAENGRILKTGARRHYGRLLPVLVQELRALALPDGPVRAAVTGANAQIAAGRCPLLGRVGDIPAIVEGVRSSVPGAGSIIDIGGQGARFITNVRGIPRFSVNEHCAGGTGSFFEDQMSRLSLQIGDYSELTERAQSIPRLSGRCAVFAKTDIIHRQQEGVSVPDILLGLCYAMVRNYKAVIVKDLPVEKPVVFTGGVTQNRGVIRAIREVFGLKEGELVIPEDAVCRTAAGCALLAENVLSYRELLAALEKEKDLVSGGILPPLLLRTGTGLSDPPATGVVPAEGCALGIDIGSTSTDLVLISRDGALADYQYLRTAGDPEGAVRRGLTSIRRRFGELRFAAVGVTGSGRERVGRMLGADAVRDEITAQAKAAVRWVPDADTVFEIGGQDSKYISLRAGEVADFQMNKICAAGTGSFVEEQAARMNIPIGEFGPLALTSERPADLGERCTVFIETAVDSALSGGASAADVAAGLCHSVVKNYLHRVVGCKPVGKRIVLQGGVAYNPGIVAAFQSVYPDTLTVSPCFSISGAYGAALLALETVGDGESSFVGFDFPDTVTLSPKVSDAIRKNIGLYRQADRAFRQGYDGTRDPRKKTVGIPYALMMHKFFPLANAFFRALGYNVILSDASGEETIRLSQQYAQGETCYPVKLIYGHMLQLAEKKADYIFMPNVRTIRHVKSRVPANYGCVYMQTAAASIAKILKLEERGIMLLNPTFDLDFGQEAMASAMLGVGAQLGKSRPECAAALKQGAMAVRKYEDAVEKQGRDLLSRVGPKDKILVLITRNYGISDPVLNMGIPELLLERGYPVIHLQHLPAHDLDLSEDHGDLYWPFGQHILSGAKLVAHHPNLYAVYLTNHGCGPDTMLAHQFREEMGDKPYLQIEVDEHFSSVGVITRIEAFLNSLDHRGTETLPEDFALTDVVYHKENISAEVRPERTLYVPDIGLYTDLLRKYFYSACGVRAEALPKTGRSQLLSGRAETSAKEYLPFTAFLGNVLEHAGSLKAEEKSGVSYLIPGTEGAEADGQYARTIRAVLNHRGMEEVHIAAPVLERLPQTAEQPDLLFRALLTGDLLALAAPESRRALTPVRIPEESELLELAKTIGGQKRSGRRIAAVGTPLTETSLNEGVLAQLEAEGEHILPAPLSEALLFQWTEEKGTAEQCGLFLTRCSVLLHKAAEALGENGTFSRDPERLRKLADRYLPMAAGGNMRWRLAKAVELGEDSAAVLCLAPRYENASMVMEMRGIRDLVRAPVTVLSFDGDWDESAWERLRSFLYYCRGGAGNKKRNDERREELQ